ncbi:hypothetical protein [Methylovulum psychrotolerans]|uniref:Lipoprotein SmpA/OmlA domain-containing protein n=1 Tax=Methylovulum psychrotolerans TaxID=1704499 RepID=A0A2S5CGV8_9GAMM|nr:hypothetical protein [Methylovulum psychrotolerans]POZ50041.1 hypothetical protein AADEFJLK_04165 [Methylovulum psychrotolerans]
MRNTLLRINLFLLVGIITACASSGSKTNTQSNTLPAGNSAASQTAVNIPSNSPFAKVKVGMPYRQVHDLIGEPTDTGSHATGKAFVPFYFGGDVMRMEDFYKGLGRIVYTGAGMGGVHFKVHEIIYDPNEDGYKN